jgi:parallel beta-helix repeat protein
MGRRVIYLVAAAAAIAAALLPGAAKAADPAICGTTITTSTTLSAVTNCDNTDATAIIIGASGVTLNLGGNTLTSYPGRTAIKIMSGLSNVTVENGTIAAGSWIGVHDYGNQTNLTIENMTIDSPIYRGISAHYDAGSLIANNTITGAGEDGIYVDYGAGNAIYSNSVTDSGNLNVELYETSYDSVEGNSATITPSGDESNTNFQEEYGDGDLWYGNLATGGDTGFGIYPNDGCCGNGNGLVTVMNNGARGQSSGYGFDIEGMYDWSPNVPGRTLVSGNVATGGINGAGGFYDSYNVGETFTGNTANRNDGDGFYFDSPWQETITNNNGSFNNGDGFYFDGTYNEGAPASVSGNSAWYNQGYGFYADEGVAGSGNTGLNGGAATNNGGECYSMTGCN